MNTTELYQRILRADERDKKVFRQIIRALIDNGIMTEVTISDEFSVSRPTVKRWLNGEAAPVSTVRKAIYKRLLTDHLKLRG